MIMIYVLKDSAVDTGYDLLDKGMQYIDFNLCNFYTSQSPYLYHCNV